jgi:hypothetical protein
MAAAAARAAGRRTPAWDVTANRISGQLIGDTPWARDDARFRGEGKSVTAARGWKAREAGKDAEARKARKTGKDAETKKDAEAGKEPGSRETPGGRERLKRRNDSI